VIRLDHITKSYEDRQPVVDDLCLHVRQRELLVLIGASGCGKTTTLKMINRLIEPSAGTIFLDGKDISTIDPVVLRRGIGYVFQMIGLFPHMTIAQNVATVPRLLGWSRSRVRARVEQLLALVSLPAHEYGRRRPSELSGGQRQRVGFARALAADPKVMLLDEPFGALDPITRDSLRAEFRRLQQTLGFTAVMVTHDMTEALLLADRIAVLQHGNLIRVGTPHELMADPQDPYVSSLLEMPTRYALQLESISAGPTGVSP
jgi:osmoprotectant transport system ATP-binding protein